MSGEKGSDVDELKRQAIANAEKVMIKCDETV